MADAQDLLKLQLNQSIGKNIVDFKLSASSFFELLSVILNRLDAVPDGSDLPKDFPAGSAARFRVCQLVGQAISELGYSGDSGYNVFMYPNEQTVIEILAFLCGRMATASAEDEVEAPAAPTAKGTNSVTAALGRLRQDVASIAPQRKGRNVQRHVVTPAMLASLSTTTRRTHRVTTAIAHPVFPPITTTPLLQPRDVDAERQFFASVVPPVNMQVRAPQSLAPTLLHWHSVATASAASRGRKPAAARSAAATAAAAEKVVGLASRSVAQAKERGAETFDAAAAAAQVAASSSHASRSRFALQRDFARGDAPAAAVVKDDDPEASRKALEQSLRAELGEVEASLSELAAKQRAARDRAAEAASVLEDRMRQLTELNDERDALRAELQQLVQEREDATNPDRAAEIDAAKAEAEARLEQAKAAWAVKDAKYQAKFDQAAAETADVRLGYQKLRDAVDVANSRVRELAAQATALDEEHDTLERELQKLPKHVDRADYLRRVADLLRVLKKQTDEIHRIQNDTRDLQRDVGSVTGALQRSAELIDARFRDHASDEWARGVWSSIISIREQFDDLLEDVERHGRAVLKQRDLEVQAERLQIRLEGAADSGIADDIAAVAAENEELSRMKKKLEQAAARG